MFYAILSVNSIPVALSIRARDMQTAMDQLNAFIAGFTSAEIGFMPEIVSISSTKPRGIEAQDIHNFVKVK